MKDRQSREGFDALSYLRVRLSRIFFHCKYSATKTSHKNEQGVQAYQSLFASQSANTMMRHLTEQTHFFQTEHDTSVGALWHSINRADESETSNTSKETSEICRGDKNNSVVVTCALCICIRLHKWIFESFHVLAWNWTKKFQEASQYAGTYNI